MDVREELDKLKDDELKGLLDKNTIIKRNSIVIWKDAIYKIAQRVKDICILIDRDYIARSVNIEYLKLLTYEEYKNIRNKKYLNCDILGNNIDKIIVFLNIILKKTYKENYEIIKVNSGKFQVTVYYPEIKIKNSLDIEHTMLDVYLTLEFKKGSYGGIVIDNYSLFRSTYTLEEYYNNYYMFSHVNNYYFNECHASSWCLGNTEFCDYVRQCHNKTLPTDILFLISQFHSYLQWESIEGVPFKRLTNLKSYFKHEIKPPSPSHSLLDKAYKEVLSQIKYLSYDFRVTSNDYEIKLESDCINNINTILSELYPELCINTIDGEAIEIKPLTFPYEATFNPKNYSKVFKGEVVPVKLIDTGKSEDIVESLLENSVKKIPPEFTTLIVERIQYHFSDYFINQKLNNL